MTKNKPKTNTINVKLPAESLTVISGMSGLLLVLGGALQAGTVFLAVSVGLYSLTNTQVTK